MKNVYKGEKELPDNLGLNKEDNRIWNEPVPIIPRKPDHFNPDWLPNLLGPYAEAIAESIQVPIDMPGMALLATLSVCNSRKYEIRVNEDHIEPINLFCVIVAEPSERKSGVLSEVTRPILEFEENQNASIIKDIARSRSEKSIIEKELRDLEEQASKDPSKKKDAISKAEELQCFREIKSKRYLVDDVTIEKLASMLYEYDGRMGIFSGEGNIFDVFSGQYKSGQQNFDCVLKAYSGEPLRVDRLGRPSEYVRRPSLTMLLGIQPSVLETIVNNKAFIGKGLISRIMLTIPESRIGSRKYKTEPIPAEFRNYYKKLIDDLMNIQHEEAQVLCLSSAAKIEVEKFHYETESRMLNDMEEIRAFGGKLIGLVHRIAANLHIARHPLDANQYPVSVETINNAIAIGRYATSHTFKAMDKSKNLMNETCRYIVDKIAGNGEQKSISKRELLRLCRKFKSSDDINSALQILQEFGYLELVQDQTSGPGRPTEEYLINPHVYKA